MRETDRIANEKFDGSIKESIKYIVENYDDKRIEDFYFDEWNDRECGMADVYMATKSLSHLSSEELNQLQKDVEMLKFTSSVDMTEKEILECKINPFMKVIAKYIIIMLCVIIVPFLIAWLFEKIIVTNSSMDFIGFVKWIVFISITPISIKLANALTSYLKFKKVKNELMSRK